MSTVPKITLASLEGMTRFAPLVVLGTMYQRSDLFAPIRSRLQFPEQMHTDHPYEALQALLVSMLAGCRSVSQINTAIRPDLVLAQAWGQGCFAEQSTIARVLDQCREAQVSQLRAGVEAIFRWISQTAQHDWTQPFWVDIDLTALPTSARAEGSTKGYFSEKKGTTAANSAGLEQRSTMKVSVRCSIQAIRTPTRLSSRRSGSLKLRYACHPKPVRKSAYASMPGLGPMTTWPGPYGRATSCVPRALAANGPIWLAGMSPRRIGWNWNPINAGSPCPPFSLFFAARPAPLSSAGAAMTNFIMGCLFPPIWFRRLPRCVNSTDFEPARKSTFAMINRVSY